MAKKRIKVKPKPSNLKSLYIILVCAILFIVALFAKQHFNNSDKITEPATFEMMPTQLPTSTATTVTNTRREFTIPVSSLWQNPTTTYTDPDINITFDYPQLLLLEKNKTNLNKYMNYDKSIVNNFFDLRMTTPERFAYDNRVNYFVSVQVWAFKNSKQLSLMDFIKELYKNSYGPGGKNGPSSLETIQKNSYKTNSPINNSLVFKGALGESNIIKVFFENKDIVYDFTLFGALAIGDNTPTPTQEEFFNKLISTIKLK